MRLRVFARVFTKTHLFTFLAASNSRWKHRLFILQRITAKSFYKLLGKKNYSLQPHQFFSIKPGYHHATSVEQFDDTLFTDEWQKDVYALAASLAREFKYRTILDIGCGSGYKLVNMLQQYDTTGIEVEPTFSWLQQKYPNRKWLLFDDAEPANLTADLVICADVIEHIDNPDDMMDFLADINFRQCIISTPERDAVAGKNDYGPPENTTHYREWNAIEFKNYVRGWLYVQEQRIFDGKSTAQVLICNKK